MNDDLRSAAEAFAAITEEDARECDRSGYTGRAIVDSWPAFQAAQEIVRQWLAERCPLLHTSWKPNDYDPNRACGCGRCTGERNVFTRTRMIVCPTCGNKRCPHAEDHEFQCTGSNEPNQVGTPISSGQR